jgi:hypothetical protein
MLARADELDKEGWCQFEGGATGKAWSEVEDDILLEF